MDGLLENAFYFTTRERERERESERVQTQAGERVASVMGDA